MTSCSSKSKKNTGKGTGTTAKEAKDEERQGGTKEAAGQGQRRERRKDRAGAGANEGEKKEGGRNKVTGRRRGNTGANNGQGHGESTWASKCQDHLQSCMTNFAAMQRGQGSRTRFLRHSPAPRNWCQAVVVRVARRLGQKTA